MGAKRIALIAGGVIMVLALGMAAWMRFGPARRSAPWHAASGPTIVLPQPDRSGGLGLHAALDARRSVRDFNGDALTLEQVGQLLWAAQGINDPRGYRTAPSAGALFPLELYLVVGAVDGLSPGLYHYDPRAHALTPLMEGEMRPTLAGASLGQTCVGQAAVTLVFAAEFERTTGRYGQRGEQYVYIEVGHAAQNVYLQAAGLGLGVVAVGAFEVDEVGALLALPEEFAPLYMLPVGHAVTH